MPTWAIVLIAVGAVVVVAAIVLGAKRARNERLDRQREEASELRLEADRRYATAKEAGWRPRSRPSKRTGIAQPRQWLRDARTRSIRTSRASRPSVAQLKSHQPA